MEGSILLVDDEPELLRALTVRLRAAGFACRTAANGREALAQIRQAHPDLIISDLLMPELDGYALCRQLQADPRTASIPIIILTAVPSRSIELHSEPLAGSPRIMHKPFDSAILLTAVRELLHGTAERS